MLDTTAHADPRLPHLATAVPATTPAVRAPSLGGMDEPGIFKGCRDIEGALPETTKRAIIAYLGKPNAASWERLKTRNVVGSTTLGSAWSMANPQAARRFPTSAELIRTIRVAVVSQWASGIIGAQGAH